ncbi:hypothetical protein C8R43DRAFT_1238415 [Mycena crocata]|nr:hypothetical protein C8R43DRAFT_1238415 [Mycena crocata]
MHVCLTVQDILEEIFWNLDPSPLLFHVRRHTESQSSLEALASLAQTCRAFHDPALDVLWQHQTLDNLLRCFPTDFVVIEEQAEYRSAKNSTMLRPLVSEDWHRVKIHARHIRRLSCHHYMALDILPTITQCLPENLFPKLRDVSCGRFHIPLILPLLPSVLEQIDVSLRDDSPPSFLTTLAHRCPRLQDLTVYDDEGAREDTSLAVRDLHFLRRLHLFSVLEWEAIHHLGRLPCLTWLHLQQLPLSPPASPETSPHFSNLKHLRLGLPGVPLESTLYLLGLFHAAPLDTLTVKVAAIVTASQISSIFRSLVRGCTLASLTKLHLITGRVGAQPDREPQYVVSAEDLRHLFCFPNLVTVSIHSHAGFNLDNAAVSDLARAWTRLETLRLTSVVRPARPRATIQCLRAFARHCPNVDNLEMSFDASDVLIPFHDDTTEITIPTTHPLTTLDVPYSPITSPQLVAEFLGDLFPNLASVSIDGEQTDAEEMAYNELWQEVDAMLARAGSGESVSHSTL